MRTLPKFLSAFSLTLFVIFYSSSSASDSITVTDFSGKKVSLLQPAKRIVSLAPHITENLFSAGAGDKIVAVVDHSDYPHAAKAIPSIGRYNAISVEKIVSFSPDLVVAWQSGQGSAIIEKLRSLGIPVFSDEPKSLEDIAHSIHNLSKLSGTSKYGEQSAKQFLQQLKTLRENNKDKQKISVFYQVWNSPLRTLNGSHIISNAISECGGENIFSDAIPVAPKINIESLLVRNPQVILASGMGEERPEWLNEWKKWPRLNSVKFNNLFFVPPDIIQRHTIRILDGTEMICRHLDQARVNLNQNTKK